MTETAPSFTYLMPIKVRYAGRSYDGKLISLRVCVRRRVSDDLLGVVEFSTRGGERTKRREFRMSRVAYGTPVTTLKRLVSEFYADKKVKLAAAAVERAVEGE